MATFKSKKDSEFVAELEKNKLTVDKLKGDAGQEIKEKIKEFDALVAQYSSKPTKELSDKLIKLDIVLAELVLDYAEAALAEKEEIERQKEEEKQRKAEEKAAAEEAKRKEEEEKAAAKQKEEEEAKKKEEEEARKKKEEEENTPEKVIAAAVKAKLEPRKGYEQTITKSDLEKILGRTPSYNKEKISGVGTLEKVMYEDIYTLA